MCGGKPVHGLKGKDPWVQVFLQLFFTICIKIQKIGKNMLEVRVAQD
jgi:hypothetical protein